MVEAKSLLIRLLQIVGDSLEYFVSGSLSFLPLAGNYRQPIHDVDAAIAYDLFQAKKFLFRPFESVRHLSLSEVAIASESPFAKALFLRTQFIHVDGPTGCWTWRVIGEKPADLSFLLALD